MMTDEHKGLLGKMKQQITNRDKHIAHLKMVIDSLRQEIRRLKVDIGIGREMNAYTTPHKDIEQQRQQKKYRFLSIHNFPMVDERNQD